MITIGIDLGGTNLRVGAVTSGGEVLEVHSTETHPEKGPEYALQQIVERVTLIREKHDIAGIGVGSPGPLDLKNGVIIEPPILPGWRNIPFRSMIEEAIGLPVVLDNDANAAALAEALIGAGREAGSVFYITISTGIGAGLVLDGRLIRGAQGNTGEIGNMIIDPSGKAAPGINKGSLEALASGTAIGLLGKERLGIDTGSKGVFQLAENGNSEAMKIVDESISYLAIGIANLVHTINPEIFVLGGGVMKSEHLILEPLIARTKDLVYPSLTDTINIESAALGQQAGLIGAALLPLEKISR
ncbi:ROK family protein [Bacillus lacus]|uniref:ROK family protein n=1 Tax=Metabacillus lacus TaxID=1983721 RepID=A0A7X2LXQ8_9BACI|nr:ROK family protein [Metabacillus lacus]MRX72815.1 ROK family protein [Metabacillus lacus]